MKFQAVIFDLFGTIVDDFAAASAGSNHAEFPAALGLPYDPFMQHWRQLTDRRSLGEFQTVEASIEHVCDIIGVSVTAEQMARAVETRLQLTRRALTPRPDAVKTLAQLRNERFQNRLAQQLLHRNSHRLAGNPIRRTVPCHRLLQPRTDQETRSANLSSRLRTPWRHP